MTTRTFKLVLAVPERLLEACSAELFAAGVGGVEEQEHDAGPRLICYGPREQLEALAEAARRAAGDAPVESQIEAIDDGWRTEWTRYLKQEVLSESLVIQPDFDDSAPPAGTRRILYQPLMAFGVGSHATTQLAAREVERWCRAQPGRRVLDVGSGNGVLCFVARLCGAGDVLGIDTDPVAVEAARGNAALNQLSVEFSSAPAGELQEQHDLVVANVELPALTTLLPELCRLAEHTLLISGFVRERAAELEEQASGLGFVARQFAELDAWGLWRLEPRRP